MEMLKVKSSTYERKFCTKPKNSLITIAAKIETDSIKIGKEK